MLKYSKKITTQIIEIIHTQNILNNHSQACFILIFPKPTITKRPRKSSKVRSIVKTVVFSKERID